MATLHQPTLRVVKVLEILKDKKDGLNITNISKESDITVGTLHPILKTLCELNYLSCENKIYKTAFCGRDELENNKMIIVYHMDNLANRLNQAVQLGVRSGNKVIYIHKSDKKAKVTLRTKVGDVAFLHSTALGKALLFNTSKNELIKIYGENELIKNTENTIDSLDELYDNIKYCEKLGYSFEFGEFDSDFACIAVPIVKNGKILAAISVTILIFYLSDELKNRIAKELLNTKKMIESDLVS